jgi:hypothetical protein
VDAEAVERPDLSKVGMMLRWTTGNEDWQAAAGILPEQLPHRFEIYALALVRSVKIVHENEEIIGIES